MPQDTAAMPPRKLRFWNANDEVTIRRGVGFTPLTKDDSLPKGAQLFIATLVSCHEVDGVMCAVYFIAAVDVVVIVGPPSSLRLHAKIRASSQANIVDPVAMRNSTMVFVPKDLVAEAVSGLEE